MQERNLYTKEIFLATIMIVNRIINDFRVPIEFTIRMAKTIPPIQESANGFRFAKAKCDASISRTRAKEAIGVVCRNDHGSFVAASA